MMCWRSCTDGTLGFTSTYMIEACLLTNAFLVFCISCSEMYKQNPLPKGMTVEEETAQARAGKGEKGRQLSTACPMRTVVERKMQELDSKCNKE